MSGRTVPTSSCGQRAFLAFLQSTVDPKILAKAAASAGYQAVGLIDTASASGLARFHKAAKHEGIRPIVGGEVLVDGAPLALFCETAEGYRNLCRLITTQHSGARGSGTDAV